MLTRRQFLGTSSAALLAVGLGGLALPSFRRKARYFLVATSPYWGREQDFGQLGRADAIPALKNYHSPMRYRTILTAVDEDGGNLRRFEIPCSCHGVTSSPEQGLVYVIGTGLPNLILALDARTLEVAAVHSEKGRAYPFTGHGFPLPGTGHVAFGAHPKPFERGTYGQISIRDARTLQETQTYSSYGFNLHEIAPSRDGKYFVCGHYGSYLGQWAYDGLETYGGAKHWQKGSDKYDQRAKPIYPASVTLVDARSGARAHLLSDVEGGQQGHFDSTEDYSIYLANRRPLLQTREGAETNPRFAAGKHEQPDDGEFAYDQHGLGISVAYDPLHREVIVPNRDASIRINVTDARTQATRMIDLAEQLAWPKPDLDFIHGIRFHPDGRHYILSTSDGFIGVERGTHRVNARLTFQLPLLVHTHLHIT